MYLFGGPTGCGKTTLARILAKELGSAEGDYREIDFADFRGIDTVRDIKEASHFMPNMFGLYNYSKRGLVFTLCW